MLKLKASREKARIPQEGTSSTFRPQWNCRLPAPTVTGGGGGTEDSMPQPEGGMRMWGREAGTPVEVLPLWFFSPLLGQLCKCSKKVTWSSTRSFLLFFLLSFLHPSLLRSLTSCILFQSPTLAIGVKFPVGSGITPTALSELGA